MSEEQKSTLPMGRTSTRTMINEKLKSSPYFHVSGNEKPQKKDYWYDLIPAATNINCGRNLSANNKWFCCNYKTSGGSSLYCSLNNKPERIPANPKNCLHGHAHTITSHDLSALDVDLLATGADDDKVLVWRLPEDGVFPDSVEPLLVLNVPGKCTCVKWSPNIAGLLATASHNGSDYVLQLWDTNTGEAKYTWTDKHTDVIMDVAFDLHGHLIATTCKDGGSRILDIHEEDPLVTVVEPTHTTRHCRCFWVDREHIIYVGVGKMSQRGICLINIRSGEVLITKKIDTNSSPLIPHYDHEYKILWCAMQGGKTCFIWQITTEAPFLTPLNTYTLGSDFTGHAFVHKQSSTDVTKVELVQSFKLSGDVIMPVMWTVPRKRMECFQDDLFPPMQPNVPLLSIEEWVAAKTGVAELPLVDRCPDGMQRLSEAPKEELTSRQKQYQKDLIMREKEPEKVAFMGNKTDEEIRQEFIKMAAIMPQNRFDAKQDSGDDVDDDEWSD